MQLTTVKVLVVIYAETERKHVRAMLEPSGYEVHCRPNAVCVNRVVSEFSPNIVIADVAMRRGPNGVETARRVRQRTSVGIILLGATNASDECLAAFAAGSDDYLKRPLFVDELAVRTSALLRRMGRVSHRVWRAGDVVVDDESGLVSRAGAVLPLTPKEHEVLVLLLRNPGRVLTKAQILEHVCGNGASNVNVVEVHVSAVRRKLEKNGPRVIHTVRREGYVFNPLPTHVRHS